VGVPLDIEVGPPLGLENATGTFATVGQVPSVALPLLVELRCYPSENGIGLNPLAIHLANNASAAPNFRAYSTGGIDTSGQLVRKNPDLEDVPSGGFNPGSRPPGRPTRRTADNTVYVGQLDYVTRVSRVHSVWIDSGSLAPSYALLTPEPQPEDQPPGTGVVIEVRGADGFVGAPLAPFDAQLLSPYGDPKNVTVLFHRDDPTWKPRIQDIDGARFLQLRFTFLSNTDADLSPELSAVGIAYQIH